MREISAIAVCSDFPVINNNKTQIPIIIAIKKRTLYSLIFLPPYFIRAYRMKTMSILELFHNKKNPTTFMEGSSF